MNPTLRHVGDTFDTVLCLVVLQKIDFAMKTVIAYALVIVGVPCLVGILLGALIEFPIIILLRESGKFQLAALSYLEVFSGLGAIISATFMFHLLGATPTIAIPIIITAWMSFYFWAYRQQLQAWCSWLVGIAVGWFGIARCFL